MNKEEFLKREPVLKFLVNGPFGSGKSTFATTFPKIYYVGTEPNGIEFLKLAENEHLLENMVEIHECYLDPLQGRNDVLALVGEMDAPVLNKPPQLKQPGLIYTTIQACQKLAAEHKVQTLVLDNLTYLSEMFWIYIQRYLQPNFITDKGNVDTLKMYGYLSGWLYRFIMSQVVSFPGNVVVTCHLKDESQEKLDKKRDKQVSVVPNILGGFRDKAEGMFTASIYLEKKMLQKRDNAGKISYEQKFYAYTDNMMAYGSKILAKNRHGLPPVMQSITYKSVIEQIASRTRQAVPTN